MALSLRDQIKALLERQLEQLKGQVKELTTQLEEVPPFTPQPPLNLRN